MAIIAVLFSAIFVASTSVLERARTQSTEAVMQVVSDAVEEFSREQQANPGIAKASRTFDGVKYSYRDRYGDYPPDELEVFTQVGLPGWQLPPQGNRSLAPGGALIAPSTISSKITTDRDAIAMRYYTDDNANDSALEFRDNAAMVLAITLHGDASKAILDRIPSQNWKSAPVDDNEKPIIWLDQPQRPGDKPNDQWGKEDLEIRYIVDNWGTPLGYYAERDWSHTEQQALTDDRVSSNHHYWRQVSSAFVRYNGGKPVIMSYGPDGQEQMTEEAMKTTPTGSTGQAAASQIGRAHV